MKTLPRERDRVDLGGPQDQWHPFVCSLRSKDAKFNCRQKIFYVYCFKKKEKLDEIFQPCNMEAIKLFFIFSEGNKNLNFITTQIFLLPEALYHMDHHHHIQNNNVSEK